MKPESSTSLMHAIYRYRGDLNTYYADCTAAEERGDSDGLPRTYEPAMMVLENWDRPAQSLFEATMAMELAIEDYEIGETPRIPAMMKAALAWMQAEGKRRGGA